MTERVEPDALDGALRVLLARNPQALVAAVDETGYRIPMPESAETVDGLARATRMPVPEQRTTLLDVVVATDWMAVAETWENVHTRGISRTVVHLRAEPTRPVTMTFIDMRHRYGCLFGFITEEEKREEDSAGLAVAGSLIVPVRPRTASVTKNRFAVITHIDDRAEQMFGYSAAEMIGKRSTEFLHQDDHERAIANWLELLSTQESRRVRLRHSRADGEWLWVEIENIYHAGADEDSATVTTVLSDISDEMAAIEAMHQREKLFRRLAESLPAGLFQVRLDRSIIYANARLATVLGVGKAETLDEQLGTVVEDDRPLIGAAFTQVLEHGIDQEFEVRIGLPGQREMRRCRFTLAALSDQEGEPGAIVTVSDVTESARLREELAFRATYDALTGCHNRASAMTALEHALLSDDAGIAAIFIDLDRFKPINDRYGHAAGDEVLVETANRLKGLLRPDDLVGRIGGDEFLLVCRGLQGPEQALNIADRAHKALHEPVRLQDGDVVALGGSIGVAVSGPGVSADTLVARADATMYDSKRAGDGLPVLWTAEDGDGDPRATDASDDDAEGDPAAADERAGIPA